MKPLYIIVHESGVYDNTSRDPRQKDVVTEIKRIKQEEDYKRAHNIESAPSNMDHERQILVCGAYYSGVSEGNSNKPHCIDIQLKALLDRGYDARVHKPGTLLSVLNAEHPLKVLLDKPKSLVG